MEKKCFKCKEIKDIENFGIHRRNGKDGFASRCRACRIQYDKRIYNQSFRGRYKDWWNGAKKRNIEWNIDFEYLDKLPRICGYTGVKLTLEPKQYNTISLDRVDNSKGYTKDNVLLCCWYINRMKNDLTLEKFIKNCQNVVDNKDLIFINACKLASQE